MFHTMHFHYGRAKTVHYYNPGANLNDLALMQLHKTLIAINQRAQVVHPLLIEDNYVESLRRKFASGVVTLIQVENESVGFLLSPILRRDDITVGHAGLVVIAKNPGQDLLTLSGLGSMFFTYLHTGTIFLTNISSTPAIIESFTRLVSNCWPSPKTSLIKAPARYRQALRLLFDEYIKKSFLNPETLELDERRFVIRSSSKAMGFNTEFRSISRASKFNYLSFCFVWLDYEKEEDMIQVGTLNLPTFVKIGLFISAYTVMAMWRQLRPARTRLQPVSAVPKSSAHDDNQERRVA